MYIQFDLPVQYSREKLKNSDQSANRNRSLPDLNLFPCSEFSADLEMEGINMLFLIQVMVLHVVVFLHIPQLQYTPRGLWTMHSCNCKWTTQTKQTMSCNWMRRKTRLTTLKLTLFLCHTQLYNILGFAVLKMTLPPSKTHWRVHCISLSTQSDTARNRLKGGFWDVPISLL